jgi:hypothetical protein
VIAYGCLRKEARREHLDYIYRGLMSHHQHAKLVCDMFPEGSGAPVEVTGGLLDLAHSLENSLLCKGWENEGNCMQ